MWEKKELTVNWTRTQIETTRTLITKWSNDPMSEKIHMNRPIYKWNSFMSWIDWHSSSEQEYSCEYFFGLSKSINRIISWWCHTKFWILNDDCAQFSQSFELSSMKKKWEKITRNAHLLLSKTGNDINSYSYFQSSIPNKMLFIHPSIHLFIHIFSF